MDIIEALRKVAKNEADISRVLADAKSSRNQAAGDVGAQYEYARPEQTVAWKAADEIERLREALRDAREDITGNFPNTALATINAALGDNDK